MIIGPKIDKFGTLTDINLIDSTHGAHVWQLCACRNDMLGMILKENIKWGKTCEMIILSSIRGSERDIITNSFKYDYFYFVMVYKYY